ncbi:MULTISPECIES: helix-turn-helix domain-containing protein [Pseudomonas]|jgi:hypothetical protein|uniref:helix-turn-helix domain-containing protein n=1 Tax=Pseudomonas TaxID=286 RepID=UPI000B222254|nr:MULTISPECIES: helix-turn-helix domain-containing protein [Pseudomonas]
MKISYLSFIPFPLPDESPISAIQRTAKENGFKHCRALLSYLNKATHQSPYGNILLANSVISRTLQSFAPEYAEQISANFYSPIHPLIKHSNAIINGIEIRYSNLRFEGSALCTQCWKEGYEKFPKDIKLFSGCPFHNCAFLFNCPSCGNRIKWKIQLSDVCKCGERLISPKLSNSENSLNKYLLKIFQLGDTEQVVTIQRILTYLELETSTCDDNVKRARRALAIALSQGDVENIINSIHSCLPSSTAEEIDFILFFIKAELSETIAATLRQQLLLTTMEQKASVAEITLTIKNLIKYIGISARAWYPLKHQYCLFKGNGRAAKINLKEAIQLKKTVTADLQPRDDLGQKTLDLRRKHVLSISAVKYMTDIPEQSIKILALNTNLLGLKKRYIRQIQQGSELLFGRARIDAFNQRYVCSHYLSRKWNIPICEINDAISTHHLQLKECNFIKETIIINKSFSQRVFSIVKQSHPCSTHSAKRFNLLRITPTEASDYLTNSECAKMLGISAGEIMYLIRERIIPCHYKGSKGRYLISKQDALDFSRKYLRISELSKQLNISPMRVSRFLSSVGIMPVHGPLVNSGRNHFYSRTGISARTLNSLIKHQHATAQPPKPRFDTEDLNSEFCISVNTICKKFSISKNMFYAYFIKNELISYKTFRTGRHITEKNAEKVCKILKNYVPYGMAAAILNVPRGYFRQLVSSKKFILDDSMFHPAKNPGLVSLKQIDELRSKNAD